MLVVTPLLAIYKQHHIRELLGDCFRLFSATTNENGKSSLAMHDYTRQRRLDMV